MDKNVSVSQPPIYLGEIRVFAGNYEPVNWKFCNGQLLSVFDNMQLYSLIGNIYGGKPDVNFNLPDLRGRCCIGMGIGPGLSERKLGSQGGSEEVTLQYQEMTEHTHSASVTQELNASGQITGSAKAMMNVNNNDGQEVDPRGNYLGVDNSYAGNYSSVGTGDYLNPSAIVTNGKVSVDIEDVKYSTDVEKTGGNQSHQNISPFLCLNYIICVNGLWPDRL
ncbi:Microcystin-dependent protein [Gracilimonas mengyeensis]|uniref:Microcystin-dependent protein n=2 Tax=Gracilimonas mengyeensis TaxID=1302730 RepID=A0A521AU55_9BACT|nr:Microcystin-dependent protein [Gracilimonas mengyeensis]